MNIAINGFGRIGRLLARILIHNNQPLKVINGVGSSFKALHFLSYDSNHGTFANEFTCKENHIIDDNNNINIINERNSIPNWQELGVSVLIDCTGLIKTKKDCQAHFNQGIKKIILSYASKAAQKTIVMGVNEHELSAKDKVISASSCTTNCLAQIVNVLQANYKIQSGFFSTIHALTNDQVLLDKNHSDLRRSRSAIESIIPTSTGAGEQIGKIFPQLENKLFGKAYRVNTKNVSLVELTCNLDKNVTENEVNELFEQAKNKYLDISYAPLVSIDYNHSKQSCIVDGLLTKTNNNMLQISAWYDNEWAYALRLMDIYKNINAV